MQRPPSVHPRTVMREAAWTWWRNVPAPRDMARVSPSSFSKNFAGLREDVCHIPMPLYCKATAAHPDLPDVASLPRQGGAVLFPSALLCAAGGTLEVPSAEDRGTKRVHEDDDRGKGDRKGGKKGGGKGDKEPRVKLPPGLHGKAYQTKTGKRLCWNYNLKGCDKATPGKACDKGLHLCAEPGCLKQHSLSEHK